MSNSEDDQIVPSDCSLASEDLFCSADGAPISKDLFVSAFLASSNKENICSDGTSSLVDRCQISECGTLSIMSNANKSLTDSTIVSSSSANFDAIHEEKCQSQNLLHTPELEFGEGLKEGVESLLPIKSNGASIEDSVVNVCAAELNMPYNCSKYEPALAVFNSDRQVDNIAMNIFDNLPIELQYKVLSYLTPTELCCSVAPVCKRWHQLAYEPILWQRLQFGSDVALSTVNQILGRATLVRWLGLYHFPEVWYLMPPLMNCHLLKSLDLKLCGGITAHNISLLVKHCPFVEALNVEGCRSVDCSSVTQIIGWKRMRHLNLSHCTLVRDESIMLLAREFVHLEELNIDGIASISDSATLVLVEERKSTMHKLYLDGDELTDLTYRSLVTCTGLVELTVSFAELMSDQGLMAIKELKSLRHLKIKRGSELSEKGLQALFECGNLNNLTCLDLSSCSNLDDAGVDAMTKCCSSLKNLGLAWCWDISDKGLEAIVNRCRYLEVVDLVGLVKITGACFSKIPEKLPHLIRLDLQQCSRIIDHIVEDVVRLKPDLKVLNYYGEEFNTQEDEVVSSRIVLVSQSPSDCHHCSNATQSDETVG